MNQVVLTGNLTRTPELRRTQEGMAVCRFTIANNKGYGEKRKTTFVSIVTFNKTAENCEKYLNKGSKIGIIGELEIRQFTGNDGQTKYMTEIIANEVEFLAIKSESGVGQSEIEMNIEDDILPF